MILLAKTLGTLKACTVLRRKMSLFEESRYRWVLRSICRYSYRMDIT